MVARGSVLRLAASLSGGALLLHELRYTIGYGDRHQAVLAEQGHAYLSIVAPLVGIAIAFAGAHFLAALERANRSRPRSPRSSPLVILWLVSSALLFVVYVGQELAEGALAPGHPAGVVGVLAHGGWSAPLLALGVGALVALLCRGAERALELAASRRVSPCRGVSVAWSLPPAPALPPAGVLARHLAGRAPPLAA